jgi:hypothetical protein
MIKSTELEIGWGWGEYVALNEKRKSKILVSVRKHELGKRTIYWSRPIILKWSLKT